MKSINTLLVLTTFAIAGSPAFSQTADVSGVTAGTPATAASINALVDAINALHERVDELEAPSGNVTLADIVGNKYCISYMGSIAGQDSNYARTSGFAGTTVLEIVSTVLGTLTDDSDDEFELDWYVDGGNGVDTGASLISSIVNTSGTGTEDITINGLTNGLLTITLSDGTETFNLSPDGNVIVGTGFSGSASESEVSLVVGMRCI